MKRRCSLPGRERTRNIDSFTPDEGAPIEIKAGDTVFLSSNTTGVWDIQETVRKVYVLL